MGLNHSAPTRGGTMQGFQTGMDRGVLNGREIRSNLALDGWLAEYSRILHGPGRVIEVNGCLINVDFWQSSVCFTSYRRPLCQPEFCLLITERV